MHVHKNQTTLSIFKLRDGQLRTMADNEDKRVFMNLFWTLTPKEIPLDDIHEAFGFGDLGQSDFDLIADRLRHKSNDGMVFRGWNQHHGSPTQQFPEPVVEIKSMETVRFPHNDKRFPKKENNEVR